MTRVPQELKDRVVAEIRRCMEIAERTYGNRFPLPRIKYTITGHTKSGWACDDTYTVNFNAEMLIKYADDFIEGRDSTVVHEFAHLVDGIVNPHTRRSTGYVRTRNGYRRKGRSCHGPTWKSIMRKFGCTPSRCHNYDIGIDRSMKNGSIKVECSCGCGITGVLGKVRAARFYANPKRYSFHSKNGKRVPIVEVKEPMPIAAQTKQTAPKKGTKKEKAIAVYREFQGKPKDFIISKIANECDMSQQGATTYYYIARKEA